MLPHAWNHPAHSHEYPACWFAKGLQSQAVQGLKASLIWQTEKTQILTDNASITVLLTDYFMGTQGWRVCMECICAAQR